MSSPVLKAFLIIGVGCVFMVIGIVVLTGVGRDQHLSSMEPVPSGPASKDRMNLSRAAAPMPPQERRLPSPIQSHALVATDQVARTEPLSPQEIVKPTPPRTLDNATSQQSLGGGFFVKGLNSNSPPQNSEMPILNIPVSSFSGQATLPPQGGVAKETTLELSPGVVEPAAFYARDTEVSSTQADAVNAISENLMKNMEQAASIANDEVLAATWDTEKESADSIYRNVFGVAQYLNHSTEAASAALRNGQ